MRRLKPSPAMVVALLALVFAMTGTGLAARAYVITSSKQIKDGAVTGADVKNSSLAGADIKNKSLSPADFNGSVQGPTGPQGVQGPQGAQGIPGAAGATKLTVRSSGPQMGDATASCLQGEVASGGGGYSHDGLIAASYPFPLSGETPTEWKAEAYQTDGGTPAQIAAWVVCAKP